MASSLTSAFRKVIELLAEIGRLLPQFETYTKIFNESQIIHHGLFLFYKDILDLHAALLNFFASKSKPLRFGRECYLPCHTNPELLTKV